jgi:hypothetical protein
MNAHLIASLAVTDELFAAMAAFVAPLGDDVLNWFPPAADSNSIAGLVHHACGSTNSWLARAIGEELARNRDSEFQGRGSAAELVGMIEQTRTEVRRRIGLLDGRDLAETIEVRRLGGASAGRVMDVSRAWCVEHALIHASEHWGHIQLTQQLHARRG